MKLTPWDKEDSQEMIMAAKRVIEMIIGGSFAGIIISPLSFSPCIILVLLVPILIAFIIVYLIRRM